MCKGIMPDGPDYQAMEREVKKFEPWSSLTWQEQQNMIQGGYAFSQSTDDNIRFLEANRYRRLRRLPQFPVEWLGNWPNPLPTSW